MSDLAGAQAAALDGLLRALELEPLGDDRFRAPTEPGRFGRAFGGQLVAQALAAASATAPDRTPSSLHACFAAAGDESAPVELAVRRVRDGRSMATRQVDLVQRDRIVLTLLATFDEGTPGSVLTGSAAPEAMPASLPSLQDWAAEAPAPLRATSRVWIDTPPPIEIRIAEPPVFLGGAQQTSPRSHWIRPVGPLGEEASRHAAVLAYASDFLLLDMAFRSHLVAFTPGGLQGTSLDHAVWFHGPVRFDRWHRYTQETVALAGVRGLVRGSIHAEDGRLVATTAQEVLVRAVDPA